MTKTIAIMQPYTFPYIGYMNLVWASDIFVLYDDVNFSKKGWINRNKILSNKKAYRFSIPLEGISQNKLIKDLFTYDLSHFKKNFIKQIECAYKNAKFFNNGLEYVRSTISEENSSISDIAEKSIKNFFEIVGVEKQFLKSSSCFSETKELNRVDRLIIITKMLNSHNYVNPVGGEQLYSKEYFSSKNINLFFLNPIMKEYRQCGNKHFIPKLSVIDLIMNLSPAEIMSHIKSYKLI